MNKYYLAYGSNLSMAQMAQRCPDAVYVGTAELKDYQLLFKGSQSGSYLTVEPKKGSTVPVLVWRISERDEHYLDPKLPDMLRKKSEIGKTVISKRHVVKASQMKEAREFLRDFLDVMDVPSDEDGLVGFIIDEMTKLQEHYKKFGFTGRFCSKTLELQR